MSRRTFAGGVCLAIGLLVGCASGGAPRGDRAAAEFAQRELGVALQWNQTQSSRVASQLQTDQLLAAPLAADDAVRIALGTNPRLQRLLAAYAASEADARQVGRAPNPLFTFERLTADGAVEIDRKLAISLIDLLQWPGRRDLSRSLQQQADMRAATDILGLATDARRAWIEAVGAQQSLQYAEQVHAAADAGATLAGRMAEGGNFAAVEQAREHAFLADATAELTRARFAATQKREQLVRMLGLRTEQADRLVLPGALPELPAEPLAESEMSRRAFDERLDVRMARARLDATARALGLTRVQSTVDALEVAGLRNSASGGERQRGFEIDVRLPVFDFGDAKRSNARATYLAALEQTAIVAVDAQSMLRESYASYRAAFQLAAHYRDVVIPLRQTISEDSLLRYNGMLISVFELLADARDTASAVRSSIAVQRDFWIADAALRATVIGRTTTMPDIEATPPARKSDAGAH